MAVARVGGRLLGWSCPTVASGPQGQPMPRTAAGAITPGPRQRGLRLRWPRRRATHEPRREGRGGRCSEMATGVVAGSAAPRPRRRQGGLKEGSRGSDPRLLGLTMGGYLIALSGSDPVDQRSSAPRVRPMRNLRHLRQSRQNRQKSLNRFGANAVHNHSREASGNVSRYAAPAHVWPRKGVAPRLARCVLRGADNG
jgi:hypothetical protein